MSEIFGVLLDTVSIQQYIFSSNKLKDNLGASYLVSKIFGEPLKEALDEVYEDEITLEKWKEEPETIYIKSHQCEVEIGYLGGGNALLFFTDKEKAKDVVKSWSLKLLIAYPGIQTAVAIESLPEDYFNSEDSFIKTNNYLFTRLAENKSRYHCCTVIPKHGISADCRESGHSAEIYNRRSDADNYISVVAEKKKQAADEAHNELEKKYDKLLAGKYSFTSRLDNLGQVSGESHLAVVHIDGNSMSTRFRNMRNLPALRNLSKSVQETTEHAFSQLLDYIINNQLAHLEKPDSGFCLAKDNGKKILPLRYIVLGGDDITFVADGRLGVHFAEKFIEFFSKEKVSDGKTISSCAGVAIVKTKYPFFRAYELAEQLCKEAKKESRKTEPESSWLDFHIAYGGFSDHIEDIRKKYFRAGEKASLIYGPYALSSGPSENEKHKDIKCLKKGMQQLKQQWPRSKRKDLRLALSLGEAGKSTLEDFKTRGLILPETESGFEKTGWLNGCTPYYDMVELMEFYPDHCF